MRDGSLRQLPAAQTDGRRNRRALSRRDQQAPGGTDLEQQTARHAGGDRAEDGVEEERRVCGMIYSLLN